MIKTSRTTQGIYLNLCKQYGIEPTIHPYTTLNEKFNVVPGIVPEDMGDLKTQYIAIGNGGLTSGVVSESDNNTRVNVTPISPVRRKVQANALYSHIPFVMRRVGEDLTQIERERYRLRVIETHNGVQYIVYYLRKIEESLIEPQIQKITYEDGERVATAYTPDTTSLFPTYPSTANTQDGIKTELTVQLRIRFTLSESDVAEIVNAVTTIYGAAGYGMISEIGLVSGADKTIPMESNGEQIEGLEVVAAQLVGSLTMGRLVELGEVSGATDIIVGGADSMTL